VGLCLLFMGKVYLLCELHDHGKDVIFYSLIKTFGMHSC
jgi:hypothetical protein